MVRAWAAAFCIMLACAGCSDHSENWDWSKYRPPAWQKFQARDARALNDGSVSSGPEAVATTVKFTFRDLKSESDRSLAQRLLGEVGKRIAFIDRHKDRWRYYRSDSDPIGSIDLYTHPYALGSQYGLCGTERYSIAFDDAGHVSTVSVTERYGVEGAIFQKSDFDWHQYEVMCTSAPATHAPSYFPAPDSIAAQHVALLLAPAIDLAASAGSLPFRLNCRTYRGEGCSDDARRYLGQLRLDQIAALTFANCPLMGGPARVCFTITTDADRLGPYPKYITVKGSTYVNTIRVDSVEIEEGFTMT